MDVLPVWCGQLVFHSRSNGCVTVRSFPSDNGIRSRDSVQASIAHQPFLAGRREVNTETRSLISNSSASPLVFTRSRKQGLSENLTRCQYCGKNYYCMKHFNRVCDRCDHPVELRSCSCRVCKSECCEPVLATHDINNTSSSSSTISSNNNNNRGNVNGLGFAAAVSSRPEKRDFVTAEHKPWYPTEEAGRTIGNEDGENPSEAHDRDEYDEPPVMVTKIVKVPDVVKGKVVGSKCRHLAQLRLSTGAKSIYYSDHTHEIKVLGSSTSVDTVVRALEKRIDFFQNAQKLQAALYPYPGQSFFLLSSQLSEADSMEFVLSKERACLGGAMACELRPRGEDESVSATSDQFRISSGSVADAISPSSPFFEDSSREDVFRRFMASAQQVQAHRSPAPFDQVKVLFILGVQQFYPLTSWDPTFAGQKISFQQLKAQRVNNLDKTMRTEFSTVLSERAVKAIAARFRSVSTVGVRVSRARGIDLYLNDHELSVGLRIRFEITSEAPFQDNWRRLYPLNIKTTNARPCMFTVVNPVGTLDFRLELAAWYQLRTDGKEEFQEAWKVARGCLWNSQRPSEVRLPFDSHARFTVRRAKYWEDVTLLGRLPWAEMPDERQETEGSEVSQCIDTEIKSGCDLRLVVTKSIEKRRICYAVTGCCPQMEGSRGLVNLMDRELATVFNFCSDTCNLTT